MNRTRRATPTQTDMFAVNHLEQCVAVFAGYSWGLIEHVRLRETPKYEAFLLVTGHTSTLVDSGSSEPRTNRQGTRGCDAAYWGAVEKRGTL